MARGCGRGLDKKEELPRSGLSDFVVVCNFFEGFLSGSAAIHKVVSRVFCIVAEKAFGVAVDMRPDFAIFIVNVPKAPASGECVEEEAEELGPKVVGYSGREFGVVVVKGVP